MANDHIDIVRRLLYNGADCRTIDDIVSIVIKQDWADYRTIDDIVSIVIKYDSWLSSNRQCRKYCNKTGWCLLAYNRGHRKYCNQIWLSWLIGTGYVDLGTTDRGQVSANDKRNTGIEYNEHNIIHGWLLQNICVTNDHGCVPRYLCDRLP
jgi:hypothetical protein